MRKPQCTGVHEDFRIKYNAESTLLTHPHVFVCPVRVFPVRIYKKTDCQRYGVFLLKKDEKKDEKKFGGKQKKRTFAIPKRKGGLRKAPRCPGDKLFELRTGRCPGERKDCIEAFWNIPEQMRGSQGASHRSYLPVMRMRATAGRRGRCPGETFEVHFELISRRTSEEGRSLLE